MKLTGTLLLLVLPLQDPPAFKKERSFDVASFTTVVALSAKMSPATS
jgi:hypothetical protein